MSPPASHSSHVPDAAGTATAERPRTVAVNASWLLADRVVRMGVGLVVGVLIARHLGVADFGLLNIGGFAAPYGALVGQIGAGPGSYRLLGTSFTGPAWATGTLVLYYWDTFTADNSNQVDVNITAVPEPATWGLMIAGFGLAGAALRRRRAALA